MNYGTDLYRILKEEKNLINRMYLNEIVLQYRKFDAALKKVKSTEHDTYEQLAQAMTCLITQLESSKYHYNKSSKSGFKKNSPIFWPTYLEDMLCTVVKRQKILANRGVFWGKHPFSMNIGVKPKSFVDMEKDLCFNYQDSPPFMQISQQIDIQLRATGKKVLSKFNLVLPLVILSVHKKLGIDQLIRDHYYSVKAKETFGLSKYFVICESIDSNVHYDEINPEIDLLFVLKRKKSSRKGGSIHAEVLKAISDNLNESLHDTLSTHPVMGDNGCISPTS